MKLIRLTYTKMTKEKADSYTLTDTETDDVIESLVDFELDTPPVVQVIMYLHSRGLETINFTFSEDGFVLIVQGEGSVL